MCASNRVDRGQAAQLGPVVPEHGWLDRRQVKRRLARQIAASGLKGVLGRGISRKARRFGARGYAAAAWRAAGVLPWPAHPPHHTPRLNDEIWVWTGKEAGTWR